MRKKTLKKNSVAFEKKLFYIALVLTIAGVVAVTDASFYSALRNFSDKFYFAKQQALWGVIGVVVMTLISFIDYKYYEKVAVPLFFASLIFLILVLVPGLGLKVYGARRWLSLGFFRFQPSELIKFSLIIYFAKLSSKNRKSSAYFIILAVVCGLVMLQPDLGTTIVLAGIGMAQIFVSGVSLIYMSGAIISGVVISLLLILTSNYRRDRLMTFLQSTGDPLGKSYHIRQILIALGSGGLFGVGLGESKQKFLFLPEAATDSIFAVVAEELGFFGSGILILIFASYVYLGLRIARNAPDNFSKVLATGIVAWIGGQTFVNIASMTALVPLTGIPLPFISYGGSSLVTVLAATGMLLSISRSGNNEKRKYN